MDNNIKKVQFKHRVSVAGAGVVGGGVIEYIATRMQQDVELARILVRDVTKPRNVVPDGVDVSDNPSTIIHDHKIDTVIEAIGGVDVAYSLVSESLKKGKYVITANKLLLATHPELLEHPNLRYEAAVAGGIPIIKSLRRDISYPIVGLEGILNGTSNYILHRMETEGIEYAEALKGAQQLGYAEADPTEGVPWPP